MVFETDEVNGKKVYTGDLSTTPEHLDSCRRVTSRITDIYFCKRTPDGEEEKVLYDEKLIKANKAGLGIRILDPTNGETATVHIGGLETVSAALSDLKVNPASLAESVGKEINAYRDAAAVWGLGI